MRMGKKKAKKAKAGSKKVAMPVSGGQTDNGRADDDGRMDFGGLPGRDLKKNLGCG
jgi:hypothetical protein